MKNSAIVSYWLSDYYGSDGRSGLEYARFGANEGFDTLFVSDNEINIDPAEAESDLAFRRAVLVPSPVRSLSVFHKISDTIPQLIWLLRVRRKILSQGKPYDRLWYQTTAVAWIPPVFLLGLSRELIWGPIGGGEHIRYDGRSLRAKRDNLKEWLRTALTITMLTLFNFFLRRSSTSVAVFAKTRSAVALVKRYLPDRSNEVVDICPEFLTISHAHTVQKPVGELNPAMWVAKDIPRKNLQAAIDVFRKLRLKSYPTWTMDLYGSKYQEPGVRGFGWVQRVPWEDYGGGVFFLLSLRDGMTSSVIDAIARGMFICVRDFGNVALLSAYEHLFVMTEEEIVADEPPPALIEALERYRMARSIQVPEIDFRDRLRQILRAISIEAV